ncbi:NIPSNAP family protein [Cnuibacter physcomitrellae]|uniref:NIPSNAP family protein n=1 Tax=Cnuibacter physcomitrellae TaxID=1619308 RepID=UPI00217607AA|nr:NIPSNAP family protein [Cnuibacter physcomitrellae]MCS5498282.1 NIPSNAP family protein [Cnuibacter physcomitrellae]
MTAASMPLLEVRTYHLLPDRREYFEARSRRLTFPLFRRHGFRVERFWTATDDPLTVVYLLGWESLEERDRKQAAFDADPDWVAMMTAADFEPSIAEAEHVVLERFVEALETEEVVS